MVCAVVGHCCSVDRLRQSLIGKTAFEFDCALATVSVAVLRIETGTRSAAAHGVALRMCVTAVLQTTTERLHDT